MCRDLQISAQMTQLSSPKHLLAVAAGSYFVLLQALSSSRKGLPSLMCNEGLPDGTRAYMSTYLQSNWDVTGDQPFFASIAAFSQQHSFMRRHQQRNADESPFPGQ